MSGRAPYRLNARDPGHEIEALTILTRRTSLVRRNVALGCLLWWVPLAPIWYVWLASAVVPLLFPRHWCLGPDPTFPIAMLSQVPAAAGVLVSLAAIRPLQKHFVGRTLAAMIPSIARAFGVPAEDLRALTLLCA